MPSSNDSLIALAARIVSAYVESHDTTTQQMPGLIRDVYGMLEELEGEARYETKPSRTLALARQATMSEPMRRSPGTETVFDDHLVCMDCGLHMKMLKRHLQTVHNLTPLQYRAKWRLPGDYPMVARQYADLRSSLAKESGLGKRLLPRGR